MFTRIKEAKTTIRNWQHARHLKKIEKENVKHFQQVNRTSGNATPGERDRLFREAKERRR